MQNGALQHKTAAFNRWKEIEIQKTQDLARRLSPDAVAQLNGELPGRIIVQVMQVDSLKDLPPHVSKLFCQVKLAGSSFKTRPVDISVPQWNEIFDMCVGIPCRFSRISNSRSPQGHCQGR